MFDRFDDFEAISKRMAILDAIKKVDEAGSTEFEQNGLTEFYWQLKEDLTLLKAAYRKHQFFHLVEKDYQASEAQSDGS